MRLVNDEGRVSAQQLVVLNFGEQNTVGHELDGAVFADLGGESHLVADGFADFLAEFFGDAFGHGARGEAARLGVADEALLAQAELEAHLGNLGGLTGAGFTRDDDDLVVADRVHDVVAAFADGQLFGVGDDLRDERLVAARCRAVLLVALVVALLVALAVTLLAGAAGAASASIGAGGVGGVLAVCVILLCTLLRGAVLYRVLLGAFAGGFFGAFFSVLFSVLFGGAHLGRVDGGGHARHGGGGSGRPGFRRAGGLICVMGFLLRHILSSVLAPFAAGNGSMHRANIASYLGWLRSSKGRARHLCASEIELKTFQKASKLLKKPINWSLIFQVWRMRNKYLFRLSFDTFVRVLQWCITQ